MKIWDSVYIWSKYISNIWALDNLESALYDTESLRKFDSLVTSKSVIMTLIAMTKSPRSPSSLFTPITSSVMGFEKVLVGIPWKNNKNGFSPTTWTAQGFWKSEDLLMFWRKDWKLARVSLMGNGCKLIQSN